MISIYFSPANVYALKTTFFFCSLGDDLAKTNARALSTIKKHYVAMQYYGRTFMFELIDSILCLQNKFEDSNYKFTMEKLKTYKSLLNPLIKDESFSKIACILKSPTYQLLAFFVM